MLGLILLVVVIIILAGAWHPSARERFGNGGIGLGGILLIIVIVLLLTGHLHI